MKRLLVTLLFLVGIADAQNTPTIGVLPDNGPNLPATCVIGQIYFRTATTIGLNQCNPANTWSALLSGSTGGTVTNTGGALTLNAVVLGAGGNDTKVSTGIITNGASVLSVGVNGGAGGGFSLLGSTSGTAALTTTVTGDRLLIGGTGVQLATGSADILSGASSSVGLRVGTSQGTIVNSAWAIGNNVISSSDVRISRLGAGSLSVDNGSTLGNSLGTVTDAGNTSGVYNTTTNCSSSAAPAVCGSAAAGSVVVAAGSTTVTVNTTAVTANSQIILQPDDSLGTKLSVTCNTTAATLSAIPWVSARTGATSFVITVTSAPGTNPECISYFIVN